MTCVPETTLPAGVPLAGRRVRLTVLAEADIDEFYSILSDPAVYTQGYVMHRRPVSAADARNLVRSVFLRVRGRRTARAGAAGSPTRSG